LLDGLNSVGAIDLESDGLSGEGLDEDLHCWQTTRGRPHPL
jgi:hypothetical protein